MDFYSLLFDQFSLALQMGNCFHLELGCTFRFSCQSHHSLFSISLFIWHILQKKLFQWLNSIFGFGFGFGFGGNISAEKNYQGKWNSCLRWSKMHVELTFHYDEISFSVSNRNRGLIGGSHSFQMLFSGRGFWWCTKQIGHKKIISVFQV